LAIASGASAARSGEISVLSVTAERNDILQQDARWLHRTCEHRRVHVGEEVIRPGVPPTHLFVVLEGEFEVRPAPEKKLEPRRLGPGALLWEVAYLRRIAPNCSVRAATAGMLLCIRPCDVDARVCEDPSFGGRFMKLITEFALEHCENGHRNGTGRPPTGNGNARYANGNGNGPAGAEKIDATAFRVPEVIEKLLRGDF
jgi:hypothetical protein